MGVGIVYVAAVLQEARKPAQMAQAAAAVQQPLAAARGTAISIPPRRFCCDW